MHATRVRPSVFRAVSPTALVCVALLSGCADARRENAAGADRDHAGTAGTGTHGSERAGSGATSSSAGSGSTSSAAGSSATDCRGPGIYGYGKGSLRLPCCTGYHEYFFPQPGSDGTMHKTCFDGPGGGQYACISGSCGDGWCEAGESAACGCVDDCPSAAWEGTDTQIEPTPLNGFTEVPASCNKPDLLARLQTSPGAIDCGNLTYRAEAAEKSAAIRCVRDAIDASKPFQVFWETLGTDSVNPGGLVARREDGQLRFFYLAVYEVNTFGLDLDGASATWSRCLLQIPPDCTDDPDVCFGIVRLDRTHCDCLPQGKRPAAPDGDKVELRCKSQ